MEIPKLYETEGIPFEKKVIYQKWVHPYAEGFEWFIAELDEKEELAFGYANLNDSVMAEWGYISLKELKENDAFPLEDWEPKPFEECWDE